MPSIHPTASVSRDTQLADDVEIGPYCSISGHVKLARGVRLLGHVYLSGPVSIGEGTIVYPFACLGFPPQDVKFKLGDKTAGVVIGANCLIREHMTIHAASNEHTPTTVGDRAFLMVNTHLAHDVRIGNDVVMVNNSGVGGHGQLGDNVTLGGGALVHQFCRVGRLAMMSGGIAVSADVPPFCLADERNRLKGLNQVGLRRSGMPRDQITELRRVFRDVFRPALGKTEMLAILKDRGATCPPIAELAAFVESAKRPICPGHGKIPRMMATWLLRLRRGEISLEGLTDEDDDSDE
jgi:UDP-N-acetylglucosamine acyltransferase